MQNDVSAFAGRWRRHLGRLCAGAALLALLGLAGPRLLLGPQLPVQPVQQRDFVQSVVASGRVQAPHRVELGAQVTGTVLRVLVVEGQSVAAGEVLVELESSEARAALAQARLALQQAALRLRQLDEVQQPVAAQALRQAQANLDSAERQRRRQQDLFEQGFIGQAALDEAQRAWEVADAALHSARQQLRTTEAAGSDRALAQAAHAAAEAAVEAAQARLAYTRITAPVAGMVVTRSVEPGAVVQAGKALLVLAPAGAAELVLQVDEKNLHLLQPGQPALASADAYPRQRFAARVQRILPGVDAQRGAVEVRLAVPDAPGFLRQDMTVSVDIEVARRPAALVLAAELLHDAEGAAPWVWVLRDGHVRRQPVQPGLRGTAQIEVRKGLAAGDLVLGSGPSVQEGARVRALLPATAPGQDSPESAP
jgi:HlyD family secretion protein